MVLMPADYSAALERAALRREATPQPLVADAAAAVPTSAEPEAIDSSGCTVWIGQLPQTCAREPSLIKNALAAYGSVTSVTVREKPGSRKSWALATFNNSQSARAAVHASRLTVPDQGRAVACTIKPSDVVAQLKKRGTGGLATVAAQTPLRATFISQRPKPLQANEDARLVREAPLRVQGQSHDIAKLTSSAILFVSEPNAAADAWHGQVHASGGAAAAAAAYKDGQMKFVELTAERCREGSILVSIGRPGPSIYVTDEHEKPVAVSVEEECPDMFCLAVGYVGDRGTLWPRGGCVLAGMHNLLEGETLGLLLDAHRGSPSVTMYKNGKKIGRRIETDVHVPGPLCWAVELPHRDDSVHIVAKPSPSAADLEQTVPPWLKDLDPVRSSVDAANRSWSVHTRAAAGVEPLPSEGSGSAHPVSIVGKPPGNRLNDPTPLPRKTMPPPRKTNEWPS